MKTLVSLLGPTGVGKTELSLRIAERFGTCIISADSRQIYHDLPIGTAAPTPEQLARVKHYFVGLLDLADYYSASQFETDVLTLLPILYKEHDVVVMTGGSMMYIDAVTKGIDDIPTVRADIREQVWADYHAKGLAPLLEELCKADPIHYDEVDRQNYKRVVHAVEICRQTGLPYSSFRTRTRVYPFRALNSLNTVGYKELFKYFEGEWTRDEAIEKIKRNSRVYARKQMTWFKRDTDIKWFHPSQETEIETYIQEKITAASGS